MPVLAKLDTAFALKCIMIRLNFDAIKDMQEAHLLQFEKYAQNSGV